MEKKIENLFGNEAFMEKFMALNTPEEIQALFAENGVEVSAEELHELIQEAMGKDAELNTEQLDNVNGGGAVSIAWLLLKGTWAFAVKVYGSPEKAVREIGLYWARKLGYRG